MSVLGENSSKNRRLSQFPSEWENIFTLSKQVSLSRIRRNGNVYRVIPRPSEDERLDMQQCQRSIQNWDSPAVISLADHRQRSMMFHHTTFVHSWRVVLAHSRCRHQCGPNSRRSCADATDH